MMNTKTSRKRLDEESNSGGQAGALTRARAPILDDDDIAALREIAKLGGGRGHVAPERARMASLRALAQQGCVDLIADLKGGFAAKLTARGLAALASAPGALAR